jgi:septin family protein
MNHPFTCIVAGPTKAGKTVFVKKLIENKERIINQDIYKIWWFYSEAQPLYHSLSSDVNFVHGLPDYKMLKSEKNEPQLIVLDDLMQEAKNNAFLTKLFTRGCHHWNISVIQIVQNAFFDGLRTSRINTDYLVLFKNPADQLNVSVIARQLFPRNTRYFLESYADATAEPHGYLFIDLTQYTPDKFRLKTNIFSSAPTLYLPENYKY